MIKIKYLGVVLLLTLLSNLNAQTCLPNGISFKNQGQINSFRANFPGCEIIEGGVFINDTNISDLDSLIDITSINGTFYLNDNASISLLGLQNITSLGGLTIIDDGLNNFQGLENVEIIYGDLRIDDCHGISTEGLTALEEVQGDFYIYDNTGLSLVGLPALEKIDGNLIIKDNEVSSLEELISVKAIGGQLSIRDNALLSSLVGLDSIDANSITELILEVSDSLSFCSVKSICDYLSMNLGPSTIGQNLSGCNTEDEILDLCSSPTAILDIETSSIRIYPNPVVDLLQISHELPDVSELIVFNSTGKELIRLQGDVKELNVAHLNGVIYILSIKSGNNIYYYKFMKMN
jgi:hypothetical protein